MRHSRTMPRTGRPIALPGPIGDLARAMPAPAGLRTALGVSHATIWKWATGVHPIPGPARLALEGLFTKYQIAGRPW